MALDWKTWALLIGGVVHGAIAISPKWDILGSINKASNPMVGRIVQGAVGLAAGLTLWAMYK